MVGEEMTLRFYENKLPYKEVQFNHRFPLDSYFGELIGDKKIVSIADLGAGMFSTTGSTWPHTTVTVYPSDILADEYNVMLYKRGVISVIPVEKQDMKNLTYPDEFFDIVHCVNALDHCDNPRLALNEMYRICKPGGWIYLRHFFENGELHKYACAHKWNISIVNDKFFMWSRNDLIVDELTDQFRSELVENYPGTVVISKLRKKDA